MHATVSLPWAARLRLWRDRCLSEPRFQRWALRFAPTRMLARRRARALFDLCAGFVYSQVLFACVRLQLFEMLRAGPLPAGVLGQRAGIAPERMLHLLNAARALGLLELRGTQMWGLGEAGAALLGNPGVLRLVEHHGLLYDDLRDPVGLLRGAPAARGLAAYWPYARNPDAVRLGVAEVDSYTSLMAATQPLVADQILDVYPLADHHCVLDVGGGDGSFLRAVARRAPHLRLMLFDLPAVAQQASRRLAEAGFRHCAIVRGGGFVRDALPPGADLVTLVRVLHDHDDDAALALLRAVRRALPEGGTLLLAEPIAGQRGTAGGVDAYFSFYLLAMGQGRPRNQAEIEALLVAAGFARPRFRGRGRPLHCAVLAAVAA